MYYDILKASKVKAEVFPDYWTLLWGRKLSASMIKTITGVLPLTFTTKGGTAADWVIYGNDDNGTENLFDGNYQSAFIDLSNNKYSALNEGRTAVIQCDPNTQYTISVWSGCNRLIVGEFETEPQINDTAIILSRYSVTIPQYITITTGANAHYIACYVSNQNNTPTISIVKGSTAPDHYIPYQQGVGERTENKMPVPVNGVYSANRTTVTVTDGVYHIVQTEGSSGSDVDIDIPEFEVLDAGYLLLLNDVLAANAAIAFKYNGTQITYYTFSSINRVAVIDNTALAGKKVNQIRINTSGSGVMDFTISPMIADSNTYTTYIPYGYQIPLTVSQQGQPDKTYDIFIGDSPLTEGEIVSKTSTGVDIELFNGENVVSTTLYNKPEMKIKYK